MEKPKEIQDTNGEFQLPEALIQHIQYFLTGKEAAQTTVLSKSWYSAWLTRPNLVFDERDFRRDGGDEDSTDAFSEFARKTIQRYEELNRKIESFRLWMVSTNGNVCLLANELIVKAMKLGAIKLDFVSARSNPSFVLPHEVLGSQTLIRLSVEGCRIDQGVNGKVSCSRLKSLSLCKVRTESHMIWNIISSCPLIEKLWFCLSGYERTFCSVGLVVDASIHLYEFHKLKCLLLTDVRIDTMFFNDFSSKIPCLKELGLFYCDCNEAIQISSTSLERISWYHYKTLRARFDVPNLRKFNYKGPDFPSLAFKTASREWDSDLSITCSYCLNTPWFVKLKKFLEKLCSSKISLTLKVGRYMKTSFNYAGYIKGLPKTVVENLIVKPQSSVRSALWDGLFWSCRPKFVTQYWLPKSCTGLAKKEKNDLLELLYKTLVQEGSEDCCIPNRDRLGLHDLEEVNVELFEASLGEWRPLPWKALLDASTSSENEQKVRFHLRWGQEPSTRTSFCDLNCV